MAHKYEMLTRSSRNFHEQFSLNAPNRLPVFAEYSACLCKQIDILL